jgi:hypothetical protein
MSKITEELRELTRIASILSRATGSITVTTKREPDYNDRGLYKKIAETVTAKIEALNAVTDQQYLAMLSGADKEITITGDLMTAKKLGETIGRVQERMGRGESFSEAVLPEIVEEAKAKKAEEFFDSVEKDTINTMKEPKSEADPRD